MNASLRDRDYQVQLSYESSRVVVVLCLIGPRPMVNLDAVVLLNHHHFLGISVLKADECGILPEYRHHVVEQDGAAICSGFLQATLPCNTNFLLARLSWLV